MKIRSDWHMHSHNSCECHEIGMKIAEIIAGATARGLAEFGITDHLHSRYNLPDIAASRKEFLECNPPANVHFGIEISCMRQWELDEINAKRYTKDPTYGIYDAGPPSPPAFTLDDEIMTAYGIEFVVGGTHWARGIPLERQAVIENFRAQNLFLARHPFVNIVAHPWWWHGPFADAKGRFNTLPWFDDFKVIPESYHDEFAAAIVENKKAVEISICTGMIAPGGPYPAGWEKQYLEYLCGLKARGVKFTIGSDVHGRPFNPPYEQAERVLEKWGFTDEDMWVYAGRTRG